MRCKRSFIAQFLFLFPPQVSAPVGAASVAEEALVTVVVEAEAEGALAGAEGALAGAEVEVEASEAVDEEEEEAAEEEVSEVGEM